MARCITHLALLRDVLKIELHKLFLASRAHSFNLGIAGAALKSRCLLIAMLVIMTFCFALMRCFQTLYKPPRLLYGVTEARRRTLVSDEVMVCMSSNPRGAADSGLQCSVWRLIDDARRARALRAGAPRAGSYWRTVRSSQTKRPDRFGILIKPGAIVGQACALLPPQLLQQQVVRHSRPWHGRRERARTRWRCLALERLPCWRNDCTAWSSAGAGAPA